MSGVDLQVNLANLDVNLCLPGRGVSAIVGPSGAGKTTLLRSVAGLEINAQGKVAVNGEIWLDSAQAISLPVHQRAVGYVFQEASLFSHLSVQRNVEFGLRRTDVNQQKIALAQVIELLGISALLQRSPLTLSGGERQRVAIARALATNPKLLLMDEPLASLDEQRKAEILPYLDQLHREFAIPILYVSHAIDEVARLADYVVMLDQGKVRAQGSVFDMVTRADLPLMHGDHACSLIEATVSSHDVHYQLSQVEFSGNQLWLPLNRTEIGSLMRLRIEARDVSLSLNQQVGSSILNTLAVSIVAMHADTLSSMIVELNAQGTRLLSRVTRKSVDQLSLIPGMALFAQIKGVAILK